MKGKGYEGGKGGKGGGGGKGFDSGKGGKGGGGKGGGKGGRFHSCKVEYVAPPECKEKPSAFIGAITWSGKDTERGEENIEFVTGGRVLQGAVKMGDAFDVVVNMCPVTMKEQQRNLYRVDFTPEVDLPRRRRYLFMEATKDCGQDLAFDGDHLCYAAQLIQNKKEFSSTVALSLPGGQTENVNVKMVWASHQKAKMNKESIMFFCTRFRAAMAAQKDRVCIDRDYFDLKAAEQVPEHNCQLAQGLSQTIYATQSGTLLNVDMIFKHIRTDTVWDLMNQMRSRAPDAVNATFTGKSVMPSYSEPKRCVIVDNVRFDLSPQSTFDCKGEKITYAEYFRRKYHIVNSDLDKKQPLLENVSRTKRDKDGKLQTSYFIPSLCHLTGLTDEMKADKFRCRELIKKTAMPPGERFSKLQANLTSMTSSDTFKKFMDPWGISVVPKLLRFQTRRLPTPAVRNGSDMVAVNEETEQWVIRGKFDVFTKAELFDKWAILAYQRTNELRELVDNLMYLANTDFRIKMQPPEIFDTNGDKRPNAFKQVVETQLKRMSPKFVLVLIPTTADEPYRSLKQLFGTYGVPSQFVSNRNIERDNLTKATKIMIQMNCKAGGAPWTVDMKMAKPTMIVGLDVHHGGDLEHKGGSVAAYVATLNKECTKLYSRTFVVKARQQELDRISPDYPGLKELTMGAIASFKKLNNVAPQCIIIYRDGGSEGELSKINKFEVAQFQQAIKEADIQCTLTFFVVLKKVRTRFFMVNPKNDTEVSNPLPGTVVDRHITSGYLPEFYLCCQSVNQGSATATKYQMIYDDSKLNADTLQMYTYCLSHMYFNWLGTIRVPAVVKYASTLAKLSGQVLRGKDVNSNLWERLHYL